MPVINNPPAFQATGLGYFNQIPKLIANANNANGLFQNLGLKPSNRNFQRYAFITSLTTSWQIAGDYGQATGARAFYPKNLSQQPISIEGIVANQYQFDLLTEFMIAHQETAIDFRNPKDLDPSKAISFHIKADRVQTGVDRSGNPTWRYISRGLPGGDNGLKVQGYVLNWSAGHARFKNAPTWTCDLQVSYDYLENPVHLQGVLNKYLVQNYIKSLGQLYQRPKQDLKGGVIPREAGSGFSDNPTTTSDDDSFFSGHKN